MFSIRSILAPVAWAFSAATAFTALASDPATGVPAVATPAAIPVPEQGWVRLPGSSRQEITGANGRAYSLFVMTPAEQAPPAGWPVVYVLDGNKWFPIVAQQARWQGRRPDKGGALPAIIVGLGYPGNSVSGMQRTHDFTPQAPQREPKPERIPGWEPPGGADSFLDVIEREVKPRIAAQYKVDPHRQVLFGHSLGGLLVLHAWLTRPASFSAFASASPSVWWNAEYILERARLAADGDGKGRGALLIAVGERELPDMVSGAKRAFGLLAPLKETGARITLRVLAEEDHVSVVPVAFNRLLNDTLMPSAAELAYYERFYDPGSRSNAAAPAVPAPAQYLAMTAQQRFDLRMEVRELKAEQREKFNAGLYDVVHGLPAPAAEMLRVEHDAWGNRHGIVPID